MYRNLAHLITRCTLMLLLGAVLVAPAFAQGSPDDVVDDFLEAWNTQNYERMYELLHPTAQQMYPFEQFQNRYESAATATGMESLSFSLNGTKLQGTSAAITYDVEINSTTFTTIADPGRTIRLLQVPGVGWRIAWSTMDIFDMLTADASLTVQAETQRRATIYDRNGLPLAQDGGRTIGFYTAQQRMPDVNECVALMGELTHDPQYLYQRIFDGFNADTVFFLGVLTEQVYLDNQSRLNTICGVRSDDAFSSSPHRIYYGGSASVPVTGYVSQVTPDDLAQGYAQGELIGRAGVEGAYQSQLAGQPPRILRIVSPTGTVLRQIASTAGSGATPIMLTVDRELQDITASALADAFNYASVNWGSVSQGGAAVVIDVQTGAVLAMATYPMIDPNLFNPDAAIEDRGGRLQAALSDVREPLRNRATSELEAPGSVFKIITLAAALNEAVVTPSENFYCGLEWDGSEYGDTAGRREDWRSRETEEPFNQPAGDVTPAQALMTSCNPFFWTQGAQLYRQAGASTIADYAQRMGLIQPYDLDGTVRAAPGTVPTPNNVTAAINEAIGQGDVVLPPIQMAVTTAAVANGGNVYEPYIIQQIGGMDGTQITYQRSESALINELGFNPGVLDVVQEGMCGVTTNRDLGTAFGRFNDDLGWVDIDVPYTVCGKTGTAETGLYPNAWFVAYAPRENPEIAVVVMVTQSLEGSQVSAPIARRIMDQYFNAPVAAYPLWWNTDPYTPLPSLRGVGE